MIYPVCGANRPGPVGRPKASIGEILAFVDWVEGETDVYEDIALQKRRGRRLGVLGAYGKTTMSGEEAARLWDAYLTSG